MNIKGQIVKKLNENRPLIPRQFNTSVDADEFITLLTDMIRSPVIAKYAKETDRNFSTKMTKELDNLKKAADRFEAEYMKAE